MACSHMIRPTKGIHGWLMKCLYEGVVIPKMLYAADVWCAGLVTNGRGKKQGGRGTCSFASQIERVQHMATLNITGGLRSSATDALDIHANVLPFQQTLCKICHRATLRMATLPEAHPLKRGVKTAYNFCTKRNFQGRKRHASPIHKLFNEFKIDPAKLETISPVRHYPKWELDTTISIAGKKKDALKEEEEADEDLRAYSDGSAYEGGVGGAAVLMRGMETVKERRFYLGKESERTVYEAEIIGMILAVSLLREAGGKGRMALGVDNQAAIRAINAFGSQPGHYLIDKLHDDLRELLPDKDGKKLTIRWTPSHKGIAGNKAADE
jgi:ribonuclease HI